MRVCSLLLLFYIISPVALYAQENAGFVQGLWYDTSAVFADTLGTYLRCHSEITPAVTSLVRLNFM
ncbi:MAG: hypothetical protein R3B69_01180 [Candidatus Paceibacterota bacterium]